MLTATETALTGPEKLRVQKFCAGMGLDNATADAMFGLFSYTKPGCDEAAYNLMEVAHGYAPHVSDATIVALSPYGLVRSNGTISETIKNAVQAAVDQFLLVMRGPENPKLKPDPMDRHYE